MINYLKGMGKNYWAGYRPNRVTTSSGPSGSSGWGKQGRKKSLGLAALGNTLGMGSKVLTQQKTTAADRATAIEQGLASKMEQVKQAAPLPPGRKRIISAPIGTPAGSGKAIGIGTKPPVVIPFNKKNPNQREIK